MLTEIKETAAGLVVSRRASKPLAFHGAAPVAQRAGAAQDAVTPASTNGAIAALVCLSALNSLAGAGVDASGAAAPVTLTGAVVGQKVVAVFDLTDATLENAKFETTITVVDQIQQLSGNLAADTLAVILSTPATALIAELEKASDDARSVIALANELRAAAVEKGLVKGSA